MKFERGPKQRPQTHTADAYEKIALKGSRTGVPNLLPTLSP
jgi:hypothetical protein